MMGRRSDNDDENLRVHCSAADDGMNGLYKRLRRVPRASAPTNFAHLFKCIT